MSVGNRREHTSNGQAFFGPICDGVPIDALLTMIIQRAQSGTESQAPTTRLVETRAQTSKEAMHMPPARSLFLGMSATQAWNGVLKGVLHKEQRFEIAL